MAKLNPKYQYEFSSGRGSSEQEAAENINLIYAYTMGENDEGGSSKSYQMTNSEDGRSKQAYGNILGAKTIEEWLASPNWAKKFNDPSMHGKLNDEDFYKRARDLGYEGPKKDGIKYLLGMVKPDGKPIPVGHYGELVNSGMGGTGVDEKTAQVALQHLSKTNPQLQQQFLDGRFVHLQDYGIGDLGKDMWLAGIGGMVGAAGAATAAADSAGFVGGASGAGTSGAVGGGSLSGVGGATVGGLEGVAGGLGGALSGGGEGVIGGLDGVGSEIPTDVWGGGIEGGDIPIDLPSVTDTPVPSDIFNPEAPLDFPTDIPDEIIPEPVGGDTGIPQPPLDLPPVEPGTPGLPEFPSIPDLPPVPPVGGGGDDLPDGEIPDIPNIPDIPDSPDVPTIPDVPDVPDTPDIPDIPDVPDVPDDGPFIPDGTDSIPGGGGGGGGTPTIPDFEWPDMPDWLKNIPASVWGAGLQGLLGYLGADAKGDALKEIYYDQKAIGAPARARNEASYAPGFSLWDQPGYGDAFDRMGEVAARKVGAKGNPGNTPSLQGEVMSNVWQDGYLPALSNYRGGNMQAGGMGLNTSAVAGIQGADFANPWLTGAGAAAGGLFGNTANKDLKLTVGGV